MTKLKPTAENEADMLQPREAPETESAPVLPCPLADLRQRLHRAVDFRLRVLVIRQLPA